MARRYLFYLRSQYWTPEEYEDFQDKMLRRLIRHAGRRIPYYQKLFRQTGLDPGRFSGRTDMHKIPLLDKETVQRRYKEFIPENVKPYKPQWLQTSGSTGTPLHFILDAATRANAVAVLFRSYRWAGYYPGKKVFTIRGYPDKKREYFYHPVWRSLDFDSVRLTRKSAVHIMGKIRQLKPKVYKGFPFPLIRLSKIADDEGLKIPPAQSIITYGETVNRHRRALIEKAYGGKVFDHYSMSEYTARIDECEYTRKHIMEDFAYHEFVDKNGKPIEPPGMGEIIGTCFYNYAMPLIRYKIRDRAVLPAQGDTCPCGRHFRQVLKIEGRMDDYIQTPDGRFAGMLEGPIKAAKGVKLCQYVQDAHEHMYVNVVPDNDFEKDSLKDVESVLRTRVGNSISIDFKIVPELELARSGKTPVILSKIGKNFE